MPLPRHMVLQRLCGNGRTTTRRPRPSVSTCAPLWSEPPAFALLLSSAGLLANGGRCARATLTAFTVRANVAPVTRSRLAISRPLRYAKGCAGSNGLLTTSESVVYRPHTGGQDPHLGINATFRGDSDGPTGRPPFGAVRALACRDRGDFTGSPLVGDELNLTGSPEPTERNSRSCKDLSTARVQASSAQRPACGEAP